MLEHIVLNHVSTHIENNQILTPYQHGFRRHLSTVTQLVESIHDFSTVINNRGQVDAIFIDLSKAFDKVSHPKLLFKLESILGAGNILRWIEDYLSDRYQYVALNAHSSFKGKVSSGVPQGSVLAPFLFLIYINDLVKDVNVKIRLFADDCILYSQINNPNDQINLNNALQHIINWCHDWQMEINSNKTVFMTITNKRQHYSFPYQIGNNLLEQVGEYKYLGLNISQNLRWDSHIHSTTNKALNKLSFLKRVLKFASPATKLLAYKTLIRPMLEYANVVWFPHTVSGINKIERVQRMAARFICNKYSRHVSPSELCRQLGLSSLEKRAKTARLKFLYELANDHFNLPKENYLIHTSKRLTRYNHGKLYEEDVAHNNCFKFSFFPRTINEWNHLPQNVVHSSSIEIFLDYVDAHFSS